jgi:ubiquinone/menaquinone biosynthesis C-methylase UbiE
MTRPREAWSGFWEHEPAANSGATLANLPRPLRDLLDAPWNDLVRRLPAKAKVLDLATGGGAVLDHLRSKRRDLQLFGVDAAPTLPKKAGMNLKGGVYTHRLPFPDCRFQAVTSRFGVEYGDIEAGAAEAARVLQHGGYIYMLVHHTGSKVLEHNRARHAALRWAAFESGWVDKALSIAHARMSMAMPTPAAFGSAAAEARARFPQQTAAWEFLTGLNQLLSAGTTAPHIAALQQQAERELIRLETLFAAACDDTRLSLLTGALEKCGLKIDPPDSVDEPDGTALAWLVKGRRA